MFDMEVITCFSHLANFSVLLLFNMLWSYGYGETNKYKCQLKDIEANMWPPKEGWREMLPPALHGFAGNFLGRCNKGKMPFHFKASFGFPPKVELELAPPPSGTTVSSLSKQIIFNCCSRVSLVLLAPVELL